MTPADRTRLHALATDALRGGYDYEAHEEPYVNLAGCVCTTPATMIALLTALDAADKLAAVIRSLDMSDISDDVISIEYALAAYDAATAKE